MGKIKQQRVAEQIRTLLSELLLYSVNDPRIQGITLTDISIDRELQHADIKVNALGDESRSEDVLAGLNSAQPFLRRELSQRLTLRKMPQLHFHWDYSLSQAIEVNELLDNLVIPPAEDEPPAESADDAASDPAGSAPAGSASQSE